MTSDNVPRVLILGHSFIRRLSSDLDDGLFPCTFDLRQCVVECFGIGGYRVCKEGFDTVKQCFVQAFESKLNMVQPRILVLQLGENDVDSQTEPLDIANTLEELTVWLQNSYAIEQLVVCELFPRERTRIRPHVYEEKRKLTNNILQTMLGVHQGIRFWKHRRLFNAQSDIFTDDHIHLSHFGQQRFFRSLRHAIMTSVRVVTDSR